MERIVFVQSPSFVYFSETLASIKLNGGELTHITIGHGAGTRNFH